MIVTNIDLLKSKCKPVSDLNYMEGEEIGAQLLKTLSESTNGIGLAANQIGIDKRVCVINVKDPIVLVNPKIVKKSKEQFIFPESCLSFPGKHVKTKRYVEIEVSADNQADNLHFSANSEDINDAFECVCVQHEIDHLDGITMFDREFKVEPVKRGVNAPIKIGRNQKVVISNGSDSKTIKYKKAQQLMEDGWTLQEVI